MEVFSGGCLSGGRLVDCLLCSSCRTNSDWNLTGGRVLNRRMSSSKAPLPSMDAATFAAHIANALSDHEEMEEMVQDAHAPRDTIDSPTRDSVEGVPETRINARSRQHRPAQSRIVEWRELEELLLKSESQEENSEIAKKGTEDGQVTDIVEEKPETTEEPIVATHREVEEQGEESSSTSVGAQGCAHQGDSDTLHEVNGEVGSTPISDSKQRRPYRAILVLVVVVAACLFLWLAIDYYRLYIVVHRLSNEPIAFPPFGGPFVKSGDDAMREMEQVLSASFGARGYVVVAGPHGVGKTTVVQIAASQVGSGILYTSVRSPQRFGHALAKTVGLMWPFNSPVASRSDEDWLEDALDCLDSAAVIARQRLGRPPVVVVDHVERLLADGATGALSLLMRFSRSIADDGRASVVFVVGDAATFNFLLTKGHDLGSHLLRLVVVGDLPKDVASALLQWKLNTSAKHSEHIVETVLGSRISDLMRVESKTWEDEEKQIHQYAQACLLGAGVPLPDDIQTDDEKSMWRALKAVLDAPRMELSWPVARRLGATPHTMDLLLKYVLTRCVGRPHLVTFQLPSVGLYALELIRKAGSQTRVPVDDV